MTKQTFKKHQFIICTFFVFIGLVTIYSTTYGGTYTGGPAGGTVDGNECGSSDPTDDPTDDTIDDEITVHSNYKIMFGDELESSDYYTITTYHDEMTIYVGYPATVKVKESNGEVIKEYPHSEVQQVTLSGLQPNTTYIVSGITTCDVEVKTEPSPESDGFPVSEPINMTPQRGY